MDARVRGRAGVLGPVARCPAAGGCRPQLSPATVAWGERDRLLIFSRQAPRARRMLPGARHVVLHGCGHVPTWDDPEQVARVLLEASGQTA